MREIDCKYTDEIVCPWCGCKMSNSDELGADSDEHECDECGKCFEYDRNIEVTYSTSKSKYGKCVSCGANDVALKSENSTICKVTDVCEKCFEKVRAKAVREYTGGGKNHQNSNY